METFNITLSPANKPTVLLTMKKVENFYLSDEFTLPICKEVVYSDIDYTFHIDKSYGITLSDISDEVYVNDDYYKTQFKDNISDISFELINNRLNKPFLGRYGYAVIRLNVFGKEYISDYISVMINKNDIDLSIENMVKYIDSNCDDYLYEQHEKSRISLGFSAQSRTSIDSKLNLLNDILSIYTHYYAYFQNSPQSKLIHIDEVGDFSKLHSISHKTIQYISTHADELQAVNQNTGICFNNTYYQPRNTLIRSSHYSCDIYENQIVVGFIETIIVDLTNMLKRLSDNHLKRKPLLEDDYIESISIIYDKHKKLLDRYKDNITSQISKFQRLLYQYKSILTVSPAYITSRPEYTNVFRSIVPYHHIYQKIIEWLGYTNYDLTKSDLILSFISTSKIYEYFCLLKILKAVENQGYIKNTAYPFRYKKHGSKYYVNTKYNNTFVYEKPTQKITIYFQPVIPLYDIHSTFSIENDLFLFRNTTAKIAKNVETDSALPYTPDYAIKIEHNGMPTRYYLLDAKFRTKVDVYNEELPNLVFKYLFSITPTNKSDELAGLCILCGKEQRNGLFNIHNKVPSKLSIKPTAHCIMITGADVEDHKDLITWLKTVIT